MTQTTPEQIDQAADALRRYEQKGKKLNDWICLSKATKEKWRAKVRIVIFEMSLPVR